LTQYFYTIIYFVLDKTLWTGTIYIVGGGGSYM